MVGLIVPAAGMGVRLGVGMPKALYTVGGQTLLSHAVRAAVESGVVSAIVVAAPPGLATRVLEFVQPEIPADVLVRVVDGGVSRQSSVRAALTAMSSDIDVVLVHDAARCLAPPRLFAEVAAAVQAGRAAVVPGLEVVDTLKQVDRRGSVVDTPDRTVLRAVQTPQGFRRGLLQRAHDAATGDEATDDAGLVERLGQPVYVVPGDESAFKVTRPLDLLLAEALLAARAADEGHR